MHYNKPVAGQHSGDWESQGWKRTVDDDLVNDQGDRVALDKEGYVKK